LKVPTFCPTLFVQAVSIPKKTAFSASEICPKRAPGSFFDFNEPRSGFPWLGEVSPGGFSALLFSACVSEVFPKAILERQTTNQQSGTLSGKSRRRWPVNWGQVKQNGPRLETLKR